MSGGQRQRLVICAAFWSKPHVIALDEPTNYLDNDSVAALTKALKDFKGAVVTVSENEAFVAEVLFFAYIYTYACLSLPHSSHTSHPISSQTSPPSLLLLFQISNEKWVVENGSVQVVQLRDAKAR